MWATGTLGLCTSRTRTSIGVLTHGYSAGSQIAEISTGSRGFGCPRIVRYRPSWIGHDHHEALGIGVHAQIRWAFLSSDAKVFMPSLQFQSVSINESNILLQCMGPEPCRVGPGRATPSPARRRAAPNQR